MRIDLHLHSKFSRRPSQWILQKIGCPESFSQPENLHRLVSSRGMTGFTLTDHNTIDGCLEIAHLPLTFISEEVTTYFPEDRCKVHVLAWNIDQGIHREIQRIRENIYDLAAYLSSQEINHAVAHPLYSINDRLTMDHFEQLLLLFRNIELNGAREEEQNLILRNILAGLRPADLERLADKHGLTPAFPEPWIKNLVGGSDDHSSLNPTRVHTRVAGAATIEEFFSGLEEGRAEPVGLAGGPKTLAHNIYGIAYQFYRHRLDLDRYVGNDRLLNFLNNNLSAEKTPGNRPLIRLRGMWRRRLGQRRPTSDKIQDILRHESEEMIFDDPGLRRTIEGLGTGFGDQEERWFDFADRLSNKVLARFSSDLLSKVSQVNLLNILEKIGSAGSLYLALAPYFISYGLSSRDRRFSLKLLDRFPAAREKAGRTGPKAGRVKMAHFTDTFFEVNGVAGTLRQQLDLAHKNGKELEVITCYPGAREDLPGLNCFQPMGVFDLPEYPELRLHLPPFLQILNHVYENGYTAIHSATPGPLGLVALGIARILGLPISGTYHTSLPQYASILTNDEAMEELVWRYTAWYYDQMDKIYVPSRETGQELKEKGIREDKIFVYPRGVDLSRFHPSHRNGFFHSRFRLGQGCKLLYVGRVSREKNLPLLVEVFKELARDREGVQLVVVGEGPYLEEMKRELTGWPAFFTGYLEGMDLVQAYASADLFVFPSATDTFGNVVLEAQASGLPVIVTDGGGPRENLIPEQSGLVIKANDGRALLQALRRLVDDGLLRARMAAAARTYAEERSFEGAFLKQWDLYLHHLAEAV